MLEPHTGTHGGEVGMKLGEQQKANQVRSQINYIKRQNEPLYNYYLVDPPEGMAPSNEITEPHDMTIRNMRALPDKTRLDVQGFELVSFHTTTSDIYDAAAREAVFMPEVATFMRHHLGATEVRVFFPFLRGEEAQRRMPGAITAPSASAHVDETHETGAQIFDMILGADADRFRGRRFAVINLWRPIRGPLQDRPLALCDARTVSPDDLMPTRTFSRTDDKGLPTPEGKILETAIYSLGYNPAHRWYYTPDMMPDEALLLKNYDSRLSGVARFSPHVSFADPDISENAPPRASIEVRCLVIW